MREILIFFGAMSLFFTSCIDDYVLELPDAKPKLVVDGAITNKQGPYLFRLTYSRAGALQTNGTYENIYDFYDYETPVLNATIIISDNIGQIDTLVPNIINAAEYLKEPGALYDFIYDENDNLIDTLCIPGAERGYYKTKNIVGLPNRLYKIKIFVEGEIFEGSDYMMEVPVIDSVLFYKKVGSVGKEDTFIPLIYFREPQNLDNYYLLSGSPSLRYFDDEKFYNQSSKWLGSIISDEFLGSYVNGIEIRAGVNIRGEVFFDKSDTLFVQMSSITKSCYDYYSCLLNQFWFDGGIYQPSPSTPPNNLTNGALGYFRASSVAINKGVIKK